MRGRRMDGKIIISEDSPQLETQAADCLRLFRTFTRGSILFRDPIYELAAAS